MPYPQLLRSDIFPYHVTCRTNNKEPFACDLEYVWKCMSHELFIQKFHQGAKTHAFVLMPNHFHLLLSTPEKNIDKIMGEFLKVTSKKMNLKSHRTGHVYGRRYYWSLIQDPFYYAHAYKYIYRNPVKAGLSQSVEEYEFSTFGRMLGLW